MTFLEPQNISSIQGMVTYGNSVTDNYLGIGILFSAYACMLILGMRTGNNFVKSSVVASWILFFVTLFMYLFAGISGTYLVISIVLLASSASLIFIMTDS